MRGPAGTYNAAEKIGEHSESEETGSSNVGRVVVRRSSSHVAMWCSAEEYGQRGLGRSG